MGQRPSTNLQPRQVPVVEAEPESEGDQPDWERLAELADLVPSVPQHGKRQHIANDVEGYDVSVFALRSDEVPAWFDKAVAASRHAPHALPLYSLHRGRKLYVFQKHSKPAAEDDNNRENNNLLGPPLPEEDIRELVVAALTTLMRMDDCVPVSCSLKHFRRRSGRFVFAVPVADCFGVDERAAFIAVAPEVLSAESLSLKSSVWSVGVVAYALAAGFSPFYGYNAPSLFDAILKADYEYPTPQTDHLTAPFRSFIDGCLVLAPENRFGPREALKHPWISQPCKKVLLLLLWANASHRSDLSCIPRDVFREVLCRHIWATRHDDAWFGFDAMQ